MKKHFFALSLAIFATIFYGCLQDGDDTITLQGHFLEDMLSFSSASEGGGIDSSSPSSNGSSGSGNSSGSGSSNIDSSSPSSNGSGSSSSSYMQGQVVVPTPNPPTPPTPPTPPPPKTYTTVIDIFDDVAGDNVTLSPDKGVAGTNVTLSYTVANTMPLNQLELGGVNAAIAPVISAGNGTRTYTINAADAADGVITITAIFTHTDLVIDHISFKEHNEGHITKTYGDAAFANAITTAHKGSGDITYHSENTDVATVDGSGQVTIHKAGSTVISAEKAEDVKYAHATTTYTLTVNPKPVTITGLSAADKEYNGTMAATFSGTAAVSGLVGSDNVTVTGTGTATFASKDVGTGKTVTISGYSLGGTDVNNYTLLAQPTTTANITAKPVTITGLSASNKPYDGSTTASASSGAVVSGKVSSDDVIVTGGTALFEDKNVGNGKTVKFSEYSLGGTDAGNYHLSAQPTAVTANITARPVTITGLSASDKVYDGNLTAAFSGTAVVSGKVGSEDVTVIGTGTAEFANKTVGTGKTVTISGYSLGGADAHNYTLPAQPTSKADITARSVSITGLSASSKTYDGNRTASVSGAVVSGKLGSDAVNPNGGTALFADKNVGNDKTVSFSGYSLSGGDAGNYSLSGQPASVKANITAKSVTITGLSASSKTYDGNETATVSGTAAVNGKVSSDDVTVTAGTASFASAAAGNNKTVTFINYSLAGGDAGNYSLSGQPANVTANIAAKSVTITGLGASDKVYNGTTVATITGTPILNGVIPGETVSLNTGSASASFASAAAGNNKTVTFSGYSLTGTTATNYSLSLPTNVTANITAKPVTITGLSASNKVYDGNATATTSGTAVVSGKEGSDAVTVTAGSAAFTNKDVGTGKTVTFSGYSLTGAAAGNYHLSAQPASVTANITAKPLTITGLSASNKTYDGNTTATHSGTPVLSGVVSGDNVTLTGTGTASFANKTVANGKTVTISGYSLGGAGAGNYSLTPPTATANITAKSVTITGLGAANKEYNGTTAATIIGTPTLNGVISGDAVTLNAGSAAFADAAVGNNKTVTFSGYTLTGADAGNYSLSQPPSVTANITSSCNGVSIGGTNYSTVQIGTQCWMAQNANYNVSGSSCPNDNSSNCNTYGRLYTWSQANSVCPTGWRLPNDGDWNTLVNYAGGSSVAGGRLKSTSGWRSNGNGSDLYGFNAKPSGSKYCLNSTTCIFPDFEYAGYWWNSSNSTYYKSMKYNSNEVLGDIITQANAFSVRCIKIP
jgi:trimeric autotransporter adhesin